MADEYISKEAFTKWIDETFCKKCEAEKRDYHHCRCGSCEYDYMRCDIEAFPAADVVPVVRCKDCKYNLANIPDIQDGMNINENWNACQLTELYDSVEPMDFCSRGAKMDGGGQDG